MLTLDNIGREIQALVRAENGKAWVQGYISGLTNAVNTSGTYYHVEMFDVVNKIQAIKVVREVTGLGLRDAKWLVEHADVTLYVTDRLAEADLFRSRLEYIGETVYIRQIN